MPGIDNNTHFMLHLNNNSNDSSPDNNSQSGSGSGFTTDRVFGSHAVNFAAQLFATINYNAGNANLALFASTSNTRSLDFWIKFNSLTPLNSRMNIYSQDRLTNASANHIEVQWDGTAFRIEGIGSGGSASHVTPDLVTPGIIVVNTWYHILMIRINNVIAFYVNGQQVSYGTIGTSNYTGVSLGHIGWSNYNPQRVLNAKLDEFRIYHGNYFDVNPQADLSDSFEVPTEEYNGTPVAPQNLVAVLGEVPEEQIDLSWDYPSFEPINPIYGYKIEQKEGENGAFTTLVANTGVHKKLALRFNGQNGGKEIIDSGITGHIVTQVGSVSLTTAQKKFGSTSMFFDGTDDRLTIPDHADWNLGAGNYTVDFWMRLPSSPNVRKMIITQFTDTNNYMAIYFFDDNKMYFENTVGGVSYAVGIDSTIFSTDTWYHIEWVRNTTNYIVFVNGVSQTLTGTHPGATAFADLTGQLFIGSADSALLNIGGLGYTPFNGYLDEVRWSKGLARHTSNFTPSTTEYLSDANTQLLLHLNSQDISGDAGSTNYHIPIFFGNAQLSTAQKQFGLSSLLLDGSSDFVIIPDSADWNFGSGDFTSELWIRPNAISATDTALIFQGTSSPNFWELGYDTTSLFLKVGTNTYSVAWTPSINTWYHVACSRYNNNLRFFVNGVQQGATLAFSENLSFSGSILIGSGFSAQEYNGYIDNLIITNRCKYVANFTAPTIESDDSTRFWKGQSNLDPETVYYYRVYALNADGQGQVSNTAFEFTEALVPNEPENLTLTEISETEVELNWEAPLDEGVAEVTGYMIERKTDDADWETLVEDTEDTDNLTYTDSGLDEDSQYHYRVSAINEEGTSRPSNTARFRFRAGLNANVRLLMHLNALPFSDASYENHSTPSNGAVTLDTINKLFGAASGAWNGIRNVGGSNLTFNNHADWDIFNDFGNTVVVDWAVRFNSLSFTQAMIVHQHTTNLDGNHWILRWKGDRFAIHGVESNLTSNWMPEMETGDLLATEIVNQTGVWYRVTFVKIGNVAAIYVNGRQYSYTASLLSAEQEVEGTMQMGRTGFSGGDGVQTLNGNLDEMRIIMQNWFNASPNPEMTDTIWIPDAEYTGVPTAPENLDAMAISASQIDLDWDVPLNDGGSPITGYRIDRSTNGIDFDTIVEDTESTDTDYSDMGLAHTTLYYYRVYAINAVGTSIDYAEATESTFATFPSAPQNLTATTQSSSEILLEWDAPVDDGGSPITGYKIYVESPIGGGFIVLVANTMSTDTFYLDTGLSPNTVYNYKIRAINAIGEGPFSNEANAKTLGFEKHIDKLTGKLRFAHKIGGRVYLDILTGEVYIRI